MARASIFGRAGSARDVRRDAFRPDRNYDRRGLYRTERYDDDRGGVRRRGNGY